MTRCVREEYQVDPLSSPVNSYQTHIDLIVIDLVVRT